MAAKKRLNNISDLFQVDTYKIGDNNIDLRPLSVFELISVLSRIKKLKDSFVGEGKSVGILVEQSAGPGDMLEELPVDVEPEVDVYKFIDIIVSVINEAPDILSDCTGIHEDDIKALPLDVVVDLAAHVVAINMKSKESLMGNWNSLMTGLQILQ